MPEFLKAIFHHRVLQRVEGDDGQATTHIQAIEGGVQRRGQAIQLAIDGDAQRLKHPTGGVAVAAGRGGHRTADDVCQLQGGFNGGFFAFPHDGAGDGTGELLLAVAPEDVGQLPLVQRSHQIGGGGPLLTHPHIQRGVVMVRKTALGCVQLVRRHADVQQNAVHPVDAQLVQRLTHMHKIGLHQRGGQALQTGTCRGDGVGVLIQRDQATRGETRGDQIGVSASSGRAIQVDAVGSDAQRLNGLLRQHREVIGLLSHRCHLT